ncbi:GGDEF domain-containing protein [Cohnella endophytica]|uniref:GGDEF domain-containing protein n=1 Tax=Cohnella endophytica TaxID=2419778 RepID=A0A494XLL7_9BACL|nr:GGDEF domain-containing protein [Cohnella endophytica]RKP51518.1 GGDEF domain-containing protein [Cohnella endophytica]
MKYTGRIVITIVVLALIALARIYGNVYYDYPMSKLPLIGILAVLICWWLGSQYDKVKFYSEKDLLTEIHNRRFVIQKFPGLLAKTGRRNENMILFLIDVDNFKKINDTYGHETGDKVLQSISRILLSNTTNKDIVARWAGDEFLIVSPYSDEKIREVIIHKVKNALKKLSEEINMDVSVAIGTSVYPNDAKTLDALLHTADRRMYEMKSQ